MPIDPVTGLAISTGVNVIGGVLGDRAAAGSRRKAAQELQRQKDIADGLIVPTVEDLQYDPTLTQYAGDIQAPDVYTPEQISNSYEDIVVSPDIAQAQMQSMGAMDQIIEGGGLTDMDRLNAERAQQASQLNASQQGMDIQQDMARRGMSGSGQEMLAKLAASQGSVNRSAEQEQQLQAQARQRAVDAILNKGSMATDMRGQASQEDQAKAAASNSINQFNANALLGQRNLESSNQLDVAKTNQAAQQGVNTQQANQQNTAAQSNAGAFTDQYVSQSDKAGKQIGVSQDMQDNYNAQGDAKAKQYTAGADLITSGVSKYTKKEKV